MGVELSDRNVNGVLKRAGMLPVPPPGMLEQLHAACAGVDGYTDAVLDISRVRPPDGMPGGGALLVLMRKVIVMVTMRKRGMFKPLEPRPITLPLAEFKNIAEDHDQGQHVVILLASDEDQSLVFVWESASECHRMFRAIIAAHGGRYEQWGIQLDPEDYVEDFDRYYAQIAADAPRQDVGWHDWSQQQFGDFDIRSALGFAVEWRHCEVKDAAGREPSSRVMRIGHPAPWVDAAPAAPSVIVWLGGRLYDDGLLGPPYDERTFDTGEPINGSDAGPARLIALVSLAVYAKATGHQRAAEWIEAARAGVPAVPQTVLPAKLRELWSDID